MARYPSKLRDALREWGIIFNVLSFGIVVLFLAAMTVRCGWEAFGDVKGALKLMGQKMAEGDR